MTKKLATRPFTVDQFKEDALFTWVSDADGQSIAGTGGRIRIADAPLFSAAPEMLTALESIRSGVEQDIKAGGGIFSDEQLALIDAALSKAAGEVEEEADGDGDDTKKENDVND